MSEDGEVIETAEGGDGMRRWRLLHRPHGLFLYEEMTLEEEICLVDEEGNEGVVVAEAYWAPSHVSGLFDSSAVAREDAIATLPWLRTVLTSGTSNGS